MTDSLSGTTAAPDDVQQSRDRFFDGRTAIARSVAVQYLGQNLRIVESGGRQIAIWPALAMKVVDENRVNGSLTLGLIDDPLPRLVLFDGAARQALLAGAPHLGQWRRRARMRGFRIGTIWTLVGILIAAGFYFGWRDGSIWLANYVPRSWEHKLGDKVREALLDGLYVCKAAPGQDALEDLIKRLSPPEVADLPVTVDVVRMKQVNAFAMPGNHIFVFSGLIDRAQTPDQLAGVLAHEMGHLELRHPTRGMIQELGLSAALSLMFGGSVAGDVALLATTLSYTRDMEREADGRAIVLLERAKIHADGLASFFRDLKKDEKSLVPDWLSNHPGLEERAAATEHDRSGDPAMSDGDWQKVKAICESR